MLRYGTDVVVIGAGIAGVTAAIELLDRGRRVLLVDRDAEANMGGLAKESFGGIWFAGTPLQRRYGIHDGAQQGLARLARIRGIRARGPLAARLGRGLRAAVRTRRSTTGCAASASSSCRCRSGSSAACTRRAIRCRAGTSSGAPGYELAVVLNRHLLSRPNVDRLSSVRSSRRSAGRHERPRDRLPRRAGRLRPGVRGERRLGRSSRAGGINGDLARVTAELARGLGPPARDDPERVAQVRRRTPARCGGAARRQRDAPRLAMELRGGHASLAAAQARPRAVAGAAEVGAVAQLARRAHRPDAARDRLRHARSRGAGLPAAARVFVAAPEPRASCSRNSPSPAANSIPAFRAQAAAARRARHAVRQPLALRRADADAARTSSWRRRSRNWRTR